MHAELAAIDSMMSSGQCPKNRTTQEKVAGLRRVAFCADVLVQHLEARDDSHRLNHINDTIEALRAKLVECVSRETKSDIKAKDVWATVFTLRKSVHEFDVRH